MSETFLKVSGLLFLCTIVLLGPGCTRYQDLPPGTQVDIRSAIVEKQEVSVAPAALAPPPSADYVIGFNDALLINISNKPEFTTVSLAANANSRVLGSRVDGDGAVHLPIIGSVKVAGLTLTEAQARVREAAKKYMNDPWVVMEVADYRSRPLYLLGQFKIPGTYYMDRPFTLSQGMALGNGFDPAANLRGARLTRGKQVVPVDIYDLLTRGDAAQNIWLMPGDSIYIPDNSTRLVFVFGAVKKPGPVLMPTGGLTLAQAIGTSDIRDAGFDINHVRIIRSLSTTRGELMVVDYEKVLRGEALPPALMEGDVVYVPKSAFGSWNDAIADLLPSLQAISALLQPFVNIKFMTQHN